MKKFLASILALAMCCAMAVPAFAEDTTIDQNSQDKTGSTAVSYSVDEMYTVTIPEKVTLGNSVTVKAEDVCVANGSVVNVSLTGTDGSNDAFELESAEGAVITYTVQNEDDDTIAIDDVVLTVDPAEASSGEAELTFVAPTSVTYAGVYEGTVTFTVSVDQVSTSGNTGVVIDPSWGEDITIGF